MTTTDMLDINKIRQDFPMLAASDAAAAKGERALAYLDTAASSQTPVQVLDAMDRYYRAYRANVHRGMYRASERATEEFEAVRRKVADLIRADEGEIVFTRGTTDSLNLAARALSRDLGPGDEVVLTVMEHHANLVPWQQLAKERGFTLQFIAIKPDYTLDLEDAARLIGPKTRVVSVTVASNVLGTIVPVAKLAALAHRHGAVVVADAAQAMGHLDVSVAKLDCDILAFSAHKMLGPTGVGVLWGRRALLEKLEPVSWGGDMIREVFLDRSVWNDVPWKFEAGTPDIAGVIGLGAAADYIKLTGIEKMIEREESLTKLAIDRLRQIPGLAIIGPDAGPERVGAVSFEIPGLHCAMPLLRGLGKQHGTTRASFAFYNTEADVEQLAQGIEKAKRIFRIE
jgi:cysteine desulfurase / selenocysteine lyase